MEKDIDRIPKNNDTDIVIRIDDFGGKRGVTIREFVKGERYTGFTKAGTRIPADKFKIFKEAINMIDEKDLEVTEEAQQTFPEKKFDSGKKFEKKPVKKVETEEEEDIEDFEGAM